MFEVFIFTFNVLQKSAKSFKKSLTMATSVQRESMPVQIKMTSLLHIYLPLHIKHKEILARVNRLRHSEPPLAKYEAIANDTNLSTRWLNSTSAISLYHSRMYALIAKNDTINTTKCKSFLSSCEIFSFFILNL